MALVVTDRMRSNPYDLVLGVGWGSSMEMAKVAAGFASNEGTAQSFVGNNLSVEKSIPSMVHTTAGPGAELTVTAMVTVEGRK